MARLCSGWTLALLLMTALQAAPATGSSDYGRSVDDMVGVFSIEKAIVLSGCPPQMSPTADPPSALADAGPQRLESLEIDPLSVDTTLVGRSVEIRAGLAGQGKVTGATFFDPSGTAVKAAFAPRGDKIYSTTIDLVQGSEPGVWQLTYLQTADPSGTPGTLEPDEIATLGFPVEFTVTSVDKIPPRLLDFDFEPKILDYGPVAFRLSAADANGLDLAEALFSSPTGDMSARVSFKADGNGNYSGTVDIPETAEPGAWLLDALTLVDGAGNGSNLTRENLASMDMPGEFLVNRRKDGKAPRITLP